MWTEICAFALCCVGDGWGFTKPVFTVSGLSQALPQEDPHHFFVAIAKRDVCEP